MELYPLRFEPIFQTYLWGGRRLETVLNKSIGDAPTYAESWEVVDHGEYQSLVKYGPLAGKPLGQLVEELGPSLLGDRCHQLVLDSTRPGNLIGRFPLLLKFLDAEKSLSVQVHPNDAMGASLDPPDLGKTEAWYVMEARPGSKIYAGLKSGVTREELVSAIKANTAESVLNSIEPKAGDCVFIPAGTVHAIGEGLLIAEVQQCSNTTFRLYDWGRVDIDGRPRDLHIDQGMEATDFSLGPCKLQEAVPIDECSESIVDCDKFKIKRIRTSESLAVDTNGSFKILVVTEGKVSIDGDFGESPLGRGDTCLIPASLESATMKVLESAELLLVSTD